MKAFLKRFFILEIVPDTGIHNPTRFVELLVFFKSPLIGIKVGCLLIVIPFKEQPKLAGNVDVLRSVGQEQTPSLIHHRRCYNGALFSLKIYIL